VERCVAVEKGIGSAPSTSPRPSEVVARAEVPEPWLVEQRIGRAGDAVAPLGSINLVPQVVRRETLRQILAAGRVVPADPGVGNSEPGLVKLL
jgi:hypothetical protein